MTTIRTIRVAAKYTNLVRVVDDEIDRLRLQIAEHDADLERAADHIEHARLLIRRATAQVPCLAREFGTVGAAIDGLKNIKRVMKP